VDEALLAVSGRRVDVRARQVDLAVLLAAVAHLTPVSHRPGCGAATVSRLRLRNLDTGSFLAAAALVSGAALEPGDPAALPCAPAEWAGGDTDRLTELLAVASVTGGSSVAVARDRFGEVHLLGQVPGSDLRIRPDRIVLPERAGPRVVELDPPPDHPAIGPEQARHLRLAATVVGPSGSAALLADAEGNTFRVHADAMAGAGLGDDVTVEIAEGSILFTSSEAQTRLVLERAPR
jgi:hypothetical protein